MDQTELNNDKIQPKNRSAQLERRGKTEDHRGSSPERPQRQRGLPTTQDRTGSILHVGKTGEGSGARRSASHGHTQTGRPGETGAQSGVDTYEGRDRRDQRGEHRDKKKDLRIVKHRRYSAEEKLQVLDTIDECRERTGASVESITQRLGICKGTYYNWKRRQSEGRLLDHRPGRPRPRYPPTPSEQRRVLAEAERRTLGYKRLAWLLVNQDIVYLRPHQVYRVLRERGLLQYQRTRPGALQRPAKPTAPDEVWHVDLMYLRLGTEWFYLVDIIDGFSRYLVHWSLNPTMTADTVTLTIQEALDRLPTEPAEKVRIVHDNGTQFTGTEWKRFVESAPVTSIATRIRHPESNGVVERLHRTHREEGIGPVQPQSYYEAIDTLKQWQTFYNAVRPHSAVRYFPPEVYYRGNPDQALKQREDKLVKAASERRAFWNEQRSNCSYPISHLHLPASV